MYIAEFIHTLKVINNFGHDCMCTRTDIYVNVCISMHACAPVYRTYIQMHALTSIIHLFTCTVTYYISICIIFFNSSIIYLYLYMYEEKKNYLVKRIRRCDLYVNFSRIASNYV